MHIVVFGAGPLLLGFLFDLILGDPCWLPHPVRTMGALISVLEKRLRRADTPPALRAAGYLLVFLCLATTFAVYMAVMALAGMAGGLVLFAVETFLTYQLLAARDLQKNAYIVYKKLCNGDLAGARRALSMIVGRDTKMLDEPAILRACVETIAESAADGIIAPLIYLALGGPVLGAVYKMVNTLDSMMGYKNERFIDFGRGAAKLDDAVNFLPSRIAALVMLVAASLCGLDSHNAFHIWKRDRRSHPSPNSGQTEAICAGALGIQLGGESHYDGLCVVKPVIGDFMRLPVREDILAANRLMLVAGGIMTAVCAVLRILGMLLLGGLTP